MAEEEKIVVDEVEHKIEDLNADQKYIMFLQTLFQKVFNLKKRRSRCPTKKKHTEV